MNSKTLALIWCAALCTRMALAEEPQTYTGNYVIGARDVGTLAVVDGRPFWFASGPLAGGKQEDLKKYPYDPPQLVWSITRTDRGFLIRHTDERGHRVYLSYDVQAPEKGVFLGEKQAPGTCWSLKMPNGSDIAKEIHALEARGEWTLDFSVGQEQYVDAEGTPSVYTIRPMRLSKGYGPKLTVTIAGK